MCGCEIAGISKNRGVVKRDEYIAQRDSQQKPKSPTRFTRSLQVA